jgi:hypothetical protein
MKDASFRWLSLAGPAGRAWPDGCRGAAAASKEPPEAGEKSFHETIFHTVGIMPEDSQPPYAATCLVSLPRLGRR